MAFVAELWPPVRLTLELSAATVLLLMVIGTPIAWWLARSPAKWKEAVAAVVALPLVLPPTVIGFYLLLFLGPFGPGGTVAQWFDMRTFAFTFEGLLFGSVIYSLPFAVNPLRQAFEAMGARPLEVAATLRAIALLGRQFVLGRSIEEALSQSQRQRTAQASQGGGPLCFSFDMLGEGARTEHDARRYAQAYEQIGRAHV